MKMANGSKAKIVNSLKSSYFILQQWVMTENLLSQSYVVQNVNKYL